jgi:hypothetical protein
MTEEEYRRLAKQANWNKKQEREYSRLYSGGEEQ